MSAVVAVTCNELSGARRVQAHFPAEQPAPSQDARLPPAHADACGPSDHRGAPAQGPQRALGLTSRVLPAALRLRRSSDFSGTVRHGARAGRRTLVVHCRPNGTDAVRVGLVVSRAVGGAVMRNKVRRRLRGVVVERRASLPSGADIVVRALAPAAAARYSTLDDDFCGALRSACGRADLSVAGG